MKKTVTITLLALLFLALFAGCNTYSRTAVTTPNYEAGYRAHRGMNHYRHDGYVADGNENRHHLGSDLMRGERAMMEEERINGRVTDRDGIIGNDMNANRPNGYVYGGYNRTGTNASTRWARDGVRTPWGNTTANVAD